MRSVKIAYIDLPMSICRRQFPTTMGKSWLSSYHMLNLLYLNLLYIVRQHSGRWYIALAHNYIPHFPSNKTDK